MTVLTCYDAVFQRYGDQLPGRLPLPFGSCTAARQIPASASSFRYLNKIICTV
jgi:hypothetical protein